MRDGSWVIFAVLVGCWTTLRQRAKDRKDLPRGMTKSSVDAVIT